MVRELCIAIDENRFTVFTAEEMCHLVEYLCINIISLLYTINYIILYKIHYLLYTFFSTHIQNL